MIIFIGLLVGSLASAAMFALGDYSLFTKGLMVGLALAAAAMQFVFPGTIHFLVPFACQLFVVISFYIAWQLE